MHGGHQALYDAEVFVEDLGDRCQAIRRARGIRDDGVVCRVEICVVDTDNVDGNRILWGCRDDDALGTTLDVSSAFAFSVKMPVDSHT